MASTKQHDYFISHEQFLDICSGIMSSMIVRSNTRIKKGDMGIFHVVDRGVNVDDQMHCIINRVVSSDEGLKEGFILIEFECVGIMM